MRGILTGFERLLGWETFHDPGNDYVFEIPETTLGELAARLKSKLEMPTVRLAGGGQVYGKVSFSGPRQLRVAAGWGSFTVPLAWCSAVYLKGSPASASLRSDRWNVAYSTRGWKLTGRSPP